MLFWSISMLEALKLRHKYTVTWWLQICAKKQRFYPFGLSQITHFSVYPRLNPHVLRSNTQFGEEGKLKRTGPKWNEKEPEKRALLKHLNPAILKSFKYYLIFCCTISSTYFINPFNSSDHGKIRNFVLRIEFEIGIHEGCTDKWIQTNDLGKLIIKIILVKIFLRGRSKKLNFSW